MFTGCQVIEWLKDALFKKIICLKTGRIYRRISSTCVYNTRYRVHLFRLEIGSLLKKDSPTFIHPFLLRFQIVPTELVI